MSTISETAKDWMLKIIQDQPADSTYEEIVRELALARMIQRGQADSAAGRIISHEEMGREIRSWQK